MHTDLERCNREIADMLEQPPAKPAWLVTLGVHDWEVERSLILRQSNHAVQGVLSTPDLAQHVDLALGE